MKIVELTGVLKSQELSVTKAISGVIVCFSGLFDDLLNEKISIYIERANGSNIVLANKILLKDFILNSTYGGEAIQSDATFGVIAVCELALDGGIFLQEKEEIKMNFEDLRAPNTYALYGVESPVSTNLAFNFEQKSVALQDVNKKIDVKGNDLAIMTLDASVSDISMYFENGQVIKYLPFELRALSVDVDPIQYIKPDGTVSQVLQGRLSLPLVHVDYIEVNKDQTAIVNFVVRTLKDLS
ncbi:hypothetical protein FNW25_01415 [Flavobacterium franklandianum]|uniref:hypothetical protein n=1 Tax=Flavobacterium franklandianum TaxID=2594430 RepID=UPI00117B5D88|nr:hypothetical protein [Flavobacterium franklandianum]TRX29645.1 hypothetical protein FNW25_01415 [Flavobacterium franklandianum]